MTLIPFVLLLQALCPLWGALYVYPWNKMSNSTKNFMICFTVICILIIYFIHFYKPDKICTTVSEKGHLLWITNNYVHYDDKILPYIWFIIIAIPFFIFWKKSFNILLLLAILPAIGIIVGKYTDAQGSIWCYYTSYTSIIASIALFLHQTNVYKII